MNQRTHHLYLPQTSPWKLQEEVTTELFCVVWICSREFHFFSLSHLIKSNSKGHTNTLYTVEGTRPFHIAVRCIMSRINIERANEESLKLKKKKKTHRIFVI